MSSGDRTKRVQLSSVVIFLVVYFLFGRVQESLSILVPLRLTLLTCIFFASVVFVRKGLSAKVLNCLWLSATFRWFCCFLVIIVVGLPFSIYQYSSLVHFLEIFLMIYSTYILALNVVIVQSSQFNSVVFSVVSSMFILSLVSIFSPRYVGGRVTAVYAYDPNDFALYLIMACSLVLPAVRHLRRFARISSYFVFALCLVSIYLTFSRGGALALLAVVLCGFNFNWKNIVLRVVLLAIVVGLGMLFVDSTSLGRFSSLGSLENDYNIHAQEGRVAVWMRGLTIVLDNPLFGVGLASFRNAEATLHEGGKWSDAHNSFIQVASELGIPGLFVFIRMLYSAYILAKPVCSSDWLGKGIRLALVAYVVGGFFLSWAYHFVLYFIIGLAMVRERMIVTSSYDPVLFQDVKMNSFQRVRTR